MSPLNTLCAALCLAVLLGPSPADASVVRRLDENALLAGSDIVVEGEVIGVDSRWNRSHTGFETEVHVAVDATDQDEARTITIVQPGGAVNGAWHEIVGMPTFTVGEKARFFLRRSNETQYRVYGWQQGVWLASQRSRTTLEYHPPNLSQSESDNSNVVHFTHNGMLWNPEQIPVQYRINRIGSDDLQPPASQEAIFAAFQTWQDVACSSLSFSYAGESDLQLAVDDTNVITWIESDWIYGEEAAAATSLFFAPGMPPSADVAFNGSSFRWGIGATSTGTDIQDVQGVLTHELGHFSGLSHTQSSLDTMYFAWTPWQSQRSLSADDKLGLCELYPQDGDECLAGGCNEGSLCQSYTRGTLCTPQADLIGDDCDYNRVECESFCLFTATDLSTGYCSQFCDTDRDCPDRFACNDASAGSSSVRVCFSDESRRVDAGPISGCSSVSDCESGFFCNATGLCDRQCAEDFDCNSAAATCSDDGQCIEKSDTTSGCGCNSASGAGTSMVLLLVFLCLGYWRQRRGGPTQ